MSRTIEFFWDSVSPYTYIAATQIEGLARDCGAQLRWRPFLLGGVFKAVGNRPPAQLPPKGKHLFIDLARWARYYGIPLTMPSAFPTNSITAQRIATAMADDPRAPDLAKALMHRYWGVGEDIADEKVLRSVMLELALDADALLAAAGDPAVKERLKANTEEAVQRGAFGAPTFFIGEDMYWGSDRMDLMRAQLSGAAA